MLNEQDDAAQGDATRAVHGGEVRPSPGGPIVFPIYQSTVYASRPDAAPDDIEYIRLSNTPSQRYLHDKLASLERADAAIATASGMSALTTVFAALLGSGDHLIAAEGLYGGTYAYIEEHLGRLGVTHTFVDAQRPDTWEAAITRKTRMFLVESISNPMMRIPHLEEVVVFARERGLVTVIDNTFATPINFKPLGIGFDVCFHSATKYLNGHSDLVAGCVAGRKDTIETIRKALNQVGAALDPHAGFLLARGLKTLTVRVRAQNANAMRLADFLSEHPKVASVHYAGLPSDPDHNRGKRLMSGFGGMLSFRLAGATAAEADEMLAQLQIAYVATSLGSVETLVTRPAATSHAQMTADQRERIGIADDLIRVSCGIEDSDDLISDFHQALAAI